MTDFPTIHAAADARGGTPGDQALASVAAWQRQNGAAGKVRGSMARLLLGLSAIDTGIRHIENGKTDTGVICIRQGLEFLKREFGA